ncbi:NB-ARC domain-containing protein [Actinokineospora diospyrosa]|uniref:NB-ARC domain-containing protein n=1 Tax=Actinokineospora diospyrosa TaxID=103728 RepID=A0ABT1IJQ1_9PSEU|nr:NB-ARC domain-containing protein [Actinokineospora diospyrosa]MCP2272880.1 NB-ARC domain-containing protein [Actinokineospora diospyrosa]
MQRQTWAAGAVTVVNIGVAIAVNLLTTNWSWVLFALLAALGALWAGLEIWRSSSQQPGRVAAAVPIGVDGFVPRPELTDQIVRALLSGGKKRVGITTTLAGAGGFGKTTLAAAVLPLPQIKTAFPDQYWVTVGQEMHGAALADAVNDVIEQVTGRRPGFTSPEQAGLHLAGLPGERNPLPLLVVDDVWTADQLRPFLNAARH